MSDVENIFQQAHDAEGDIAVIPDFTPQDPLQRRRFEENVTDYLVAVHSLVTLRKKLDIGDIEGAKEILEQLWLHIVTLVPPEVILEGLKRDMEEWKSSVEEQDEE